MFAQNLMRLSERALLREPDFRKLVSIFDGVDRGWPIALIYRHDRHMIGVLDFEGIMLQ